MKLAIMVTLSILGFTPALAAAKGEVELCRRQGFDETFQKSLNASSFTLPAGTSLNDLGAQGNYRYGTEWALEILLLKPAIFKAGVKCVDVPAVISPNSKVQSVSPADKRYFEIGEVLRFDGTADDESPALPEEGLNVTGSVIAEFTDK